MKANPLLSEGARMERDAIRRYLKRTIKAIQSFDSKQCVSDFNLILNWVDARKVRYNKKKGGLGK